MKLILIDADVLRKWIDDINKYDYSRLTIVNSERMMVILTARKEAYENVLSLVRC